MQEIHDDCNCPDAFMSHELLEEGDLWASEYHWSKTFSDGVLNNQSSNWLNINPHNAFYGIALDNYDGTGGFYYDSNVCHVPSPGGATIAIAAMIAIITKRKR